MNHRVSHTDLGREPLFAQLNALGFRVVGSSSPYPEGHFSNGSGVVLFQNLAGGWDCGIRRTANRMGWSTDILSAVGVSFVRADDPTQSEKPSLFTALREQLGLKLESAERPMDYLVIDSIARPTPD